MISNYIQVTLDKNSIQYRAFKAFAVNRGLKTTPAALASMINELPETKELGIPAVTEALTPIENPAPKENDTDSKSDSQ